MCHLHPKNDTVTYPVAGAGPNPLAESDLDVTPNPATAKLSSLTSSSPTAQSERLWGRPLTQASQFSRICFACEPAHSSSRHRCRNFGHQATATETSSKLPLLLSSDSVRGNSAAHVSQPSRAMF